MIPISLYIHIPWCIRKCPYCDFNSHELPSSLVACNQDSKSAPVASNQATGLKLPNLLEIKYVEALLSDLNNDLARFELVFPEIHSIFIGGGTPSLFSPAAYQELFSGLDQLVNIKKETEITLEANPGTVEQSRFCEYRNIGINRLSLGIQSFNPEHLKQLGRIHDDNQAKKAIESARKAGFDNINIDIMHSLPNQSIAEGLHDLQTAISYQPEHISWYQLTLEPNTVFYKNPPPLPKEEMTFDLEQKGFALLEEHNFKRYEISAFCQGKNHSQHNLNYWQFGDYLGIGAGAHGKITTKKGIYRTRKHRLPKEYLAMLGMTRGTSKIEKDDIIFEFMLNTTRLEAPISNQLFTQTTGLAFEDLKPKLVTAQKKGLLSLKETQWCVTDLGRKFTNDLQALFLS